MHDLESEYSDKAARKARARAAQQRRIVNQRKAIEAAPVEDKEQLSDLVAQLASAWGSKRKA